MLFQDLEMSLIHREPRFLIRGQRGLDRLHVRLRDQVELSEIGWERARFLLSQHLRKAHVPLHSIFVTEGDHDVQHIDRVGPPRGDVLKRVRAPLLKSLEVSNQRAITASAPGILLPGDQQLMPKLKGPCDVLSPPIVHPMSSPALTF